jgi:hypothetical protein
MLGDVPIHELLRGYAREWAQYEMGEKVAEFCLRYLNNDWIKTQMENAAAGALRKYMQVNSEVRSDHTHTHAYIHMYTHTHTQDRDRQTQDRHTHTHTHSMRDIDSLPTVGFPPRVGTTCLIPSPFFCFFFLSSSDYTICPES